MGQSFTNLLYHFVFSTKGREPWLDEALRPALFAQMGAIIKKEGGIALLISGMPDHVHILAKLRPDHRVSEIMSDVKSRSSGWVHRTYADRQDFFWQTGYGAFTVSQSQIEVVRHYIANQEKHHREMPFEREYLGLFRKHGIEVDEQTLWD